MKLKILLINLFFASLLFSESEHIHKHNHDNEIGLAIGFVPGHEDEDSSIGLHLHYIKGIGEHNDFGLGVSLETILDEHSHNSISLIGTYHLKSGFTIAYAPGILFEEHGESMEYTFTQHLECYYEFELSKFHIGPQIDVGFEDSEIHFMFGLHLGLDF